MPDSDVTITWLGHATTRFDHGDTTILVDPFLKDNPAVPDDMKSASRVDLILITHGHYDHFADAVPIAQQTGAHVICIFEIGQYLRSKGVDNVTDMNKGGTVHWNGFDVTMVDAIHSSDIVDGDRMVPGGSAAGFVVRFPNGFVAYHAGDTDVYEGFKLTGQRYNPDVALLPIGGHYTMDPQGAAEAARMLGAPSIIPIHYGTWPPLAGTPDQLKQALGDAGGIKVVALKPGETVKQSDLV
ncbi:MAG TPA: metal-dependent hydrolase [Chloroflexota bacterium]|nr:metal-dependent hydrolase [Chloroflexota bacterium]